MFFKIRSWLPCFSSFIKQPFIASLNLRITSTAFFMLFIVSMALTQNSAGSRGIKKLLYYYCSSLIWKIIVKSGCKGQILLINLKGEGIKEQKKKSFNNKQLVFENEKGEINQKKKSKKDLNNSFILEDCTTNTKPKVFLLFFGEKRFRRL